MRNIHGDCVPLLLAILMSGVQASPDPGDEGDGAAAGGGVGPPDPEPGFSRGESIALWVGVILFVIFLTCLFWNLCAVTCRTIITNVTGRRKKKLNPTEKRVNKILSNDSAREILKAHAIHHICRFSKYINWTIDILPENSWL